MARHPTADFCRSADVVVLESEAVTIPSPVLCGIGLHDDASRILILRALRLLPAMFGEQHRYYLRCLPVMATALLLAR